MVFLFVLILSYFLTKSFWVVGILIGLYLLSTWLFVNLTLLKLGKGTKVRVVFWGIIFLGMYLALTYWATISFGNIIVAFSFFILIWNYFSEKKMVRIKQEEQELQRL